MFAGGARTGWKADVFCVCVPHAVPANPVRLLMRSSPGGSIHSCSYSVKHAPVRCMLDLARVLFVA
jgi:hypothetical protein